MDGLLIDSEPLWDQAEVEVMESLGVDTRRRDELPDLLGLRIDLVVDLWYAQQPWHGVDRAEATARIIRRAIELVEASRPLLPGVREAVALCKAQGLKVGLASASPLVMLEKVLNMFELRDQFDALASAEHLPLEQTAPAGIPQLRRCPGSRPAALRRAGGFGQRHDRQQSRAHARYRGTGSGEQPRPALRAGGRQAPVTAGPDCRSPARVGRWRVTRSLSRRRQ